MKKILIILPILIVFFGAGCSQDFKRIQELENQVEELSAKVSSTESIVSFTEQVSTSTITSTVEQEINKTKPIKKVTPKIVEKPVIIEKIVEVEETVEKPTEIPQIVESVNDSLITPVVEFVPDTQIKIEICIAEKEKSRANFDNVSKMLGQQVYNNMLNNVKNEICSTGKYSSYEAILSCFKMAQNMATNAMNEFIYKTSSENNIILENDYIKCLNN
ncbi:MAG: hypothetical protein PHQ18_05745 [Patescibacteria group bacterium]|nr:hypothetical protein [Patescibacteria group bacterium]